MLLLISSYVFYAAWSPPLIILIWISTGIDFYISRLIYKSRDAGKRKLFLITSLLCNLGLLGYFKYAEFMINYFSLLLSHVGITYMAPELDIILPIGISFYTFQTLSYTIDVYRGRLKPVRSFLDFALYVTFFPQLVAGPIVRASHFLPQCLESKRADLDTFCWGLTLFVFGLFTKLVLADLTLAPVVDLVYSEPAKFGWYDGWTAVFAFSGQIYFDFAGYSLCAIGSALCFGFQLPDNFRAPYGALGFADFWQRWHITLSTWIRDYLYIPMGGNRKSRGRTLVNLGITMFLAGLWHGAAWTFVLWGWLHGFFLISEHVIRRRFGSIRLNAIARTALMLGTFLIVSLAWIPFRSQGLDNLRAMGETLFRTNFADSLPVLSTGSALAVIAAMVLGHIITRGTTLVKIVNRIPPTVQALVTCILILSIALSSTGDSRGFIYFQF